MAFSGVKVWRQGALSLGIGTFTDIQWDAEIFKEGQSYHSTTVNPERIVIPTTGYYRCSGKLVWGGGTNNIVMRIRLNGSSTYLSRKFEYSFGTAAEFSGDFSTTLMLTAGDYITLEVGPSANITVAVADPTFTFFEVIKVG